MLAQLFKTCKDVDRKEPGPMNQHRLAGASGCLRRATSSSSNRHSTCMPQTRVAPASCVRIITPDRMDRLLIATQITGTSSNYFQVRFAFRAWLALCGGQVPQPTLPTRLGARGVSLRTPERAATTQRADVRMTSRAALSCARGRRIGSARCTCARQMDHSGCTHM